MSYITFFILSFLNTCYEKLRFMYEIKARVVDAGVVLYYTACCGHQNLVFSFRAVPFVKMSLLMFSQ